MAFSYNIYGYKMISDIEFIQLTRADENEIECSMFAASYNGSVVKKTNDENDEVFFVREVFKLPDRLVKSKEKSGKLYVFDTVFSFIENKTLYIKKNVSGELEENMQMDTIETSEWNILRTEDKSNWSERPETGEKIIYVGIGITGEKIDATEEEKIEYINMINPDLYIRKVIFYDNAKTTYTYITTDDKGKQVQQTVEGYIPIMIGYYNEKQKNVAKQYVTLKDEYTDENYYSDQFYNVTTKLFSNDIINEKCLVPTIAQCVGFRIQEDGKYVIEFFKFGKSNGLGSIKEAIADNTAQNLIKINELKNEKIKSDAENEINYAIIKNDSGEDINSNLQAEKKSFSITTKDVIVLAIIGIMIVICLIILEINIMKRKNN